jgi:hypothetical protein
MPNFLVTTMSTSHRVGESAVSTRRKVLIACALAILALCLGWFIDILFAPLALGSLVFGMWAVRDYSRKLSPRGRCILFGMGMWQLLCLVGTLAYPYVVAPLVVKDYIAAYGDIQADYGRFERMAVYIFVVTVTGTASLSTLVFYRLLNGSPKRWTRTFVTFALWQIAVTAILICSYETSFSYRVIHELEWTILGAPDNLYGFRNIMVHRIIAWLICTMPLSWLALRLYGLDEKTSLPICN